MSFLDTPASLWALRQLDPHLVPQSLQGLVMSALAKFASGLNRNEKFNVLNIRNDFEDLLDAMETDYGIDLKSVYDDRKFQKRVKNYGDLDAFILSEFKPGVIQLIADHDLKLSIKKPLVSNAVISDEIDRYLHAKPDTTTFAKLEDIVTTIHLNQDHNFTQQDLENFIALLECPLLPVLAVLKTTIENTVHQYFSSEHLIRFTGAPCKPWDPEAADLFEPAGPSFFRSSRKTTKTEPKDLKRAILASRGHLLIWSESSQSYVPHPEPLAVLVATVPGLDLPPDRAIVFVADPSSKAGALVYIRLNGNPKRIANFDLDDEPEGPITYITSEKDIQNRIILTWGHIDASGHCVWKHHACIEEDNLLDHGTLKRDSKVVFEDYGDPIDRSGKLGPVRYDFRDHGNLLTLKTQGRASEVISYDVVIFSAQEPYVGIYGYPHSFVVASPYRKIELIQYVDGHMIVTQTAHLDQWAYKITGLTVV